MAVDREKIYECEVKRGSAKSAATGGYEPFWKAKGRSHEALLDAPTQSFAAKTATAKSRSWVKTQSPAASPTSNIRSRPIASIAPTASCSAKPPMAVNPSSPKSRRLTSLHTRTSVAAWLSFRSFIVIPSSIYCYSELHLLSLRAPFVVIPSSICCHSVAKRRNLLLSSVSPHSPDHPSGHQRPLTVHLESILPRTQKRSIPWLSPNAKNSTSVKSNAAASAPPVATSRSGRSSPLPKPSSTKTPSSAARIVAVPSSSSAATPPVPPPRTSSTNSAAIANTAPPACTSSKPPMAASPACPTPPVR